MAELLDVYDANKKHIGVADRTVIHTFGLWHKTIHCWIIWNGKMVFQRRGKRRPENPNKLYTTASGHLGAGESPVQAFSREVMEEIGITPKDPKFVDETVWVGDFFRTDGSLFVDRVFPNMFWAKHDGELSDLKFTDGEVDGVVAIDLDDFIKWARAAEGGIAGLEWNGKKISEIKLTSSDFLLTGAETVYSKFGKTAEIIKNAMK